MWDGKKFPPDAMAQAQMFLQALQTRTTVKYKKENEKTRSNYSKKVSK